MRAYRSRVAAVSRVRALREELARAALARAAAEEVHARAECERRSHGRSMHRPPASGSVEGLRASLERSRLAAASEAWAQDRARQAAGAELAARGVWNQAATELKAIELYEQRRREEHMRAERRRAVVAMDEIAAVAVSRRRPR